MLVSQNFSNDQPTLSNTPEERRSRTVVMKYRPAVKRNLGRPLKRLQAHYFETGEGPRGVRP